MMIQVLVPFACWMTILLLQLQTAISQTYDAIVIGGGAGGCVAAQTMVDQGKNVLLLERGGDSPVTSKSDVFSVLNDGNNSCIETFNGDGVLIATGNCLGGATTFNQAIWIEERSDFLAEYGGIFDSTSVKEAFDFLTSFFAPLPTSQSENSSTDIYIRETIDAFDAHPLFDVANVTPGQPNLPLQGIWRTHSAFDPVTGVRYSADKILDRNSVNLEIQVNAKVEEILFKVVDTVPTAQCVKYRQGRLRRIKEVCVNDGGRIFLAAGAIHTPVLLMKSGIMKGGKTYDNDQVGNNLSDKPLILYSGRMKEDFEYPNATVGELAAYLTDYKLNSGSTTDLLFEELSLPDGSDGFQFALFERVLVDALGTDESRFGTRAKNLNRLFQFCLDRFDKRTFFCSSQINPIIEQFGKTANIAAMVATPKSTGQVSLKPNGEIVVQPGYFSNADDIEAIGAALRIAIEVKSTVTGKSELQTIVSAIKDVEGLTDVQIGELARSKIVSPYHYGGTAAIGKVVDNQLKVIGVNGLYVADASALPRTPRVNAMVSTMLIGRLAGQTFV